MSEETVQAIANAIPEADSAELQKALDGVSMDQSNWIEPKSQFPVRVEVSRYRLASDEYRAANKFRQAITEPLPQWDLRMVRLDARGRSKQTGEEFPLVKYGGYDLKKFDQESGKLVPLTKRNRKEAFINEHWTNMANQMGVRMADPTVFEGKAFMVDFYRAKSFGGPTPAKNVTVPVQLLPDDYVYQGDIQIIEIDTSNRDGSGAGGSDIQPATTNQLGQEEAFKKLAELLNGRNLSSEGAVPTFLNELPQELRLPSITAGLVTKTLLPELEQKGFITVGADGTIAQA